MKKPICFIVLSIFSISLIAAQFSSMEKILIHKDSIDTPMRILVVTNEEDSLFLRQKCEDVNITADSVELHMLIDRLKQTMEVESGIGIAAPQVGIGKNIFLFIRLDLPGFLVEVAINPQITGHASETVCFERDGCLSIPNRSGNSIRYPWVDVEYTNERGERVSSRLKGGSRGEDYTGIIFQHEYDHLQGVLYTDKLCGETAEK
jgi:peptide deformylase